MCWRTNNLVPETYLKVDILHAGASWVSVGPTFLLPPPIYPVGVPIVCSIPVSAMSPLSLLPSLVRRFCSGPASSLGGGSGREEAPTTTRGPRTSGSTVSAVPPSAACRPVGRYSVVVHDSCSPPLDSASHPPTPAPDSPAYRPPTPYPCTR